MTTKDPRPDGFYAQQTISGQTLTTRTERVERGRIRAVCTSVGPKSPPPEYEAVARAALARYIYDTQQKAKKEKDAGS